MKTLKPGFFGHRGCLGKKAEAKERVKEANRVSAKCAIAGRRLKIWARPRMHWAALALKKNSATSKNCTYLRRWVRASASAGAGTTKISRLRRAGFLKPSTCF
jgi:hypothetical protein